MADEGRIPMMRLIGGLVGWEPGFPATDALRAMATALPGSPPRVVTVGPTAGFFTSVADATPTDADDIAVVADLDLTNGDELRALTGATSHTGLLAALYALDGPAFVERLRGAFALALLDHRTNKLVLAVDHFGIKRLHYTTDRRRTAFASRPSPLRHVAGVDAPVDPEGVYAYLNFGYVAAAAPIFEGIHRIPPGHRLLVQDGRAVVEQYWDLTYPEAAGRKADSADALYRLTEQAVARTLHDPSPKESGAFLSGGTDSSTVVGLMSRLSGERVNAFSIGFGDEVYNELDYAELAARHFGASHYTHIVTPDEALARLPRLVDAYDEPFGNNSAIGTYACAELARECGMKRLLAGDGGDEIFGGNERYRVDRIFARYHRAPAALRRGLLEPILFGLPDGGATLLGRAQRYVRRANLPNPGRFYSYEFFFAQHAAEWLAPDFLAAVAADRPYTILQAHYDRGNAWSDLNRLLYLDLKLTIGDNDLVKVTRTAELAGVDVRFPLLDLPLVEFTGTIPSDFKVRGTEKRHLFKRAFASLLPPATLAKRKHGFGVPTSVWLRSHPQFRRLARDVLLSPRATQRGYFRPGALERLFELHDVDATSYYGDLLWTVLMLELWHGRHVDAGGPR
jgi:asparagine synthase (glutamine-hydrolysing)